MVSEKQIKKFVDDRKVIKLIDRIYSLQSVNADQFDTVYSFIEENGRDVAYSNRRIVPDGEFMVKEKIDRVKTKSYLGLSASVEYNYQEIKFCNPDGSKHWIRKYNDGKLLRN